MRGSPRRRVRSFSCTLRAETSSSAGAVQDRLGLALDLRAHQIRQRPADGGAQSERQRHVDERDVRAVGGRERHAHAGVLAQQVGGPHRHLLQQHEVGVVLVITSAISRRSLRRL